MVLKSCYRRNWQTTTTLVSLYVYNVYPRHPANRNQFVTIFGKSSSHPFAAGIWTHSMPFLVFKHVNMPNKSISFVVNIRCIHRWYDFTKLFIRFGDSNGFYKVYGFNDYLFCFNSFVRLISVAWKLKKSGLCLWM